MSLKVSIITASYNSARFIEKTIQSVKNQSYSPIEHIVMDGASTDGSVEILRRYEGTYDLHWRSEPDSGQSQAYNKGILAASGEWLYFLNSDDYLIDNDAIKRVAEYFQDNPGYSIYMGKVLEINQDGIIEKFKNFLYPIYTHDILLNKHGLVNHQGTFYKREVFDIAGLYLENFQTHMDYEFHLRATKFFDISIMNLIVAYMLIHPEAKSKRLDSNRFIELYRARRINGGKIFHRFTLLFFKRYLATNKVTAPFYNFLLRWKVVHWISKSIGWKSLDF